MMKTDNDTATGAGLSINASMSMAPQLVPPSAWIGHLPFAFWAVEEARPRILVELGAHNGTSYLGFCQAVARCALETKCFAVDTWQGDEHSGFYGDQVFETLSEQNQSRYGGFSQLMRMTFDDALPYFADGSIDLLHIDGLHTYEAVSHDFESWLPKLSDRAVVLFHDTMVRERNFGVWKLWAELRQRYAGFEFLHTHGLGVLLVGARAPRSFCDLAALSGSDLQVPVLRLFDALGARIYASERAVAAEAGLAQALRDAQASMAAAQSAHEYLAGRVATLESGETALLAQLGVQREAAAAARDAEIAAQASLARALEDAQRSAAEAGEAQASLAGRARDLELGEAALQLELQAERDAVFAARQEYERLACSADASRREAAERIAALDIEVAASAERIAALDTEVAVSAERIAALDTEVATSAERAAALAARVDTLESELQHARDVRVRTEARLVVEIARADAVSEAAARQAATDAAELAAQRARVDELLQSTSWKLTAPARWLSTWLRGR